VGCIFFLHLGYTSVDMRIDFMPQNHPNRQIRKDLLAQEFIIFRMGSYPEPKQPFGDFNCKRAIVKTYSDRPVLPNLFEMQ
jgi:hypothetical protein